MNLWPIFFIGLTTGGLSCLAVQGGLLMSLLARNENQIATDDSARTHIPTKFSILRQTQDKFLSFQFSNHLFPLALFLSAKLISHILLGFFLGLLGSAITLSDTARLTFQIIAAFFMFATAMNLLNVHPIFRYIVLQPPKFITKRVRVFSRNSSLFAPFLLGLFTVFIPCGVTQAMEVQAIALGNPLQSALLMAAFVIGTMPLFSIIGVTMAKLSEGLTAKFMRFAAFALIAMSLYSVNGVLEVVNAPISAGAIKNGWVSFWTPNTQKPQAGSGVPIVNGLQMIRINILNNGYEPNYIRVKKDVPVRLSLQAGKVYSCAVDFRLQAFGIKQFMEPNTKKTFDFTPTKSGKYRYTCGMGMYTGVLEVM